MILNSWFKVATLYTVVTFHALKKQKHVMKFSFHFIWTPITKICHVKLSFRDLTQQYAILQTSNRRSYRHMHCNSILRKKHLGKRTISSKIGLPLQIRVKHVS